MAYVWEALFASEAEDMKGLFMVTILFSTVHFIWVCLLLRKQDGLRKEMSMGAGEGEWDWESMRSHTFHIQHI